MSEFIFISGGARSGKSTFAEKKVLEYGNKIGYIATAIITDVDMEERIKHHQNQRSQNFVTFEQYKDISELFTTPKGLSCEAFLLDCVTIAITNLLFDEALQLQIVGKVIDYDACPLDVVNRMETFILDEFSRIILAARKANKTLVTVTNEVGLGLVSPYRLGNLFRDISGRVNQMLARESTEAYFMVSGLPMRLK